MSSIDEFVNSPAWLAKVSGTQRGRDRHAAPTADAHGGRLAARAQPPPPAPRPADAMELADVPRHRPLAFDRMESLIREMQDPESGVPVRSQKLFLSVIPSAFMGYDLVEWLMDRYNLDESSNVEAINLANQLCHHGYFFPVNDLKALVLKDDSSLYRFQSPYYWPWQAPRVAGAGTSAPTLGPDNVEYAIFLVKRTLRNKQRHALEEYEQEALTTLKKNLAAKWDVITMQAEEQVRIAKERKKGDKIVIDSQERAYWRVARPPPNVVNALEPCPVPVRARHHRIKKRSIHQVTREIEHLRASLDRTRVKTSIALEALVAYSETFAPYDPWLTPPQPSNPWVSDDTLFWQINNPLVEIPSEKRVQRWSLSIDELVSDPTGLQEFTSFLRKEYSHENIRFWLAVKDLRQSSTKHIPKKLDDIYEEFLKPGAPCEINIDGATAERVTEGIRSGSRYALDHAADHVYGLLLKKDCYPRFVRSDHFQRLLTEGKNVHQKKAKFFNFGGQVKKKPGALGSTAGPALSRRRGSERSLSGSAHELAVCAAQPPRATEPPSHSHSQSNLADIPFRDPLDDDTADVLPWECSSREYGGGARRRQDSAADSGSSSSDVSGACGERRRLPQQSTLDGGLRGAPPPLRRLSAVEPRHLAPLASPPHLPRPAPPPPAPAPAPLAHPTPTISVSSAPDDESGTGSPDEPRSIAQSDDPSSVFASADATPTEPVRHAFRCEAIPSDGSGESAQETPRDGPSVRPSSSVMGAPSIDSCDESAVSDSRDSTDRTRSSDDNVVSVRRVLSREPSTMKETSPASCTDTCNKTDLPKSEVAPMTGATCAIHVPVVELTVAEPEQSERTKCVAPPMTKTSATVPISAAPAPEPSFPVVDTYRSAPPASSPLPDTANTAQRVAGSGLDSAGPAQRVADPVLDSACPVQRLGDPVTNTAGSVPRMSGPVPDSAGPAQRLADPVRDTGGPVARVAGPVPDTSGPVPRVAGPVPDTGGSVARVAGRAPDAAGPAPLAVCEDIVDDENVDKVPSAPLQRVSEDSRASSMDATKTIAHKDELTSVSETNIVKRDNKGIGERKQRNDICPWEDENSCESDAPFVKTYATLGYL